LKKVWAQAAGGRYRGQGFNELPRWHDNAYSDFPLTTRATCKSLEAGISAEFLNVLNLVFPDDAIASHPLKPAGQPG
jgi:hypothetical protein